MGDIVITGGRVVAPGGVWDSGSVHIQGAKIAAVSPRPLGVPGARIINAAGHYVSPGFIDIHVHGGNGADFCDGTLEAFETITRFYARYGVTALQATTYALPLDVIRQVLATYRAWQQERRHGGSAILGVHLEGPYFNQEQRGAQPAQYIRNPGPEDLAFLLDNADVITEVTLAPEIPGALEMIRHLATHGIVVAAGHSSAREPEILGAIEAGLSHVSHIYSSMSSVIREGPWRVPGLLEVALTHPALTTEMIADGKHLPPTLMRLIARCRGTDRLCIVSDAIRAAGGPEGVRFISDGYEIIIEDGVAIMGDYACFAGSITPLSRMVSNAIRLAGLTLAEAVGLATCVPAQVLHISGRKGSLAPGMDADIAIFDENINVVMTIVDGEIVHKNKQLVEVYR